MKKKDVSLNAKSALESFKEEIGQEQNINVKNKKKDNRNLKNKNDMYSNLGRS